MGDLRDAAREQKEKENARKAQLEKDQRDIEKARYKADKQAYLDQTSKQGAAADKKRVSFCLFNSYR